MNLTLAICVYNAAKYLPETLLDIQSQTYKDFKILFIDDCSTDNTIEVLTNFKAASNIDISIVRQSENKGIAHARDLALKTADTKYLLFIDGDDRLDKNLVSKLYESINGDKDLIAVTCWSRFIDMNGNKIAGGTFLGVRSKEEFMQKAAAGKLFFMPIHTIMNRDYAFRAGGFVTTGFPTDRPRYQDFCEELDLWTRMSDFYAEGKYFNTIPEVLYYYRKDNGLSSNHFNMILKMRYTKTNVRRRRAGKDNLTFTEFYDSLTQADINQLKKEAYAADNLRNGVMLLKQKKVLSGGIMVLKSIIARPSYFLDKLKHNL